MMINRSLCLAVLLFGCLAAQVLGHEFAVKTSQGSTLVETESEKATRMLQLRWRLKPTGSDFWEELFWFTESQPVHGQQETAKEDTLYQALIADRRMRILHVDGVGSSSQVEITVEEITTTQIVIKVHCTTRLWSDEKSMKETDLNEVFKVPLKTIGLTTQGEGEFAARWWNLAEPSLRPEPPVGRE